jgi:hypothetical protein
MELDMISGFVNGREVLRERDLEFPLPPLALWKYNSPQSIDPRNQWLVIWNKVLSRVLDKIALGDYCPLLYLSWFCSHSSEI